MFRYAVAAAVLALLLSLGGCKKSASGNAYALTSAGQILQFAVDKPGTITQVAGVTGLPANSTGQATETLVQFDYRPADRQLYAVTSGNHVFLVNPVSGQATSVGTGAIFSNSVLVDPQMDFDPVHDFMRVVSSDQNLDVAPDGSLISSGNPVAYASGDVNAGRTPALIGIAYDNDYVGAGSSTLYALDATTQDLVTIGNVGGSPQSPDGGVLFTIGGLGVGFGSVGGFDIEAKSNIAYAALALAGAGPTLYTVDLGSGAATQVGTIGDGSQTVIALAVAPDG